MKEQHRALPAELLQDTNHFIPPAVFARAARATFALSTGAGRPTWNLVVSNVPGPAVPALLRRRPAGRPLSGLGDHRRHGAEHHRDELRGHMDFGIVADRDQIPDLWRLMDRLRDSLEELLAAA